MLTGPAWNHRSLGESSSVCSGESVAPTDTVPLSTRALVSALFPLLRRLVPGPCWRVCSLHPPSYTWRPLRTRIKLSPHDALPHYTGITEPLQRRAPDVPIDCFPCGCERLCSLKGQVRFILLRGRKCERECCGKR